MKTSICFMKILRIGLAPLLFLILLPGPVEPKKGKHAFGAVYLKNFQTGKNELLKSYFNKGPVVINFWATYCRPCREEMPELQKLMNNFPDKKLIFINIDPGSKIRKVGELIKEWGITGTVLLDRYQVLVKKYNPKLAVPATFLIGSDGRLKYESFGYKKTTISQLRRELKKLR